MQNVVAWVFNYKINLTKHMFRSISNSSWLKNGLLTECYLVGWTSKMCQTFSLAPSNEQNRIEIPNRPWPPHNVLGVMKISRTWKYIFKFFINTFIWVFGLHRFKLGGVKMSLCYKSGANSLKAMLKSDAYHVTQYRTLTKMPLTLVLAKVTFPNS